MTRRILIQDTVAVNRIVLRCKLSAACYDVQTVETQEEVFPALRGQTTDLLLLDCDTDAAASLALCKQVTERREGAAPTVVLMAAQPDARFEIAALAAGAAAVLPKPLDGTLLLATLRRCQRQMHTYSEALQQGPRIA